MGLPPPRHYRSYLVRCWYGVDADEARYIVEMVSDAPQQRGFGTLDELLAFLREELGGAADTAGASTDVGDHEGPAR